MKHLIKVQEVYRVNTDAEAEVLIAEAKNDNRFVLVKYNCESKEVKAKGEVIDEYIRITLNKVCEDTQQVYVGKNSKWEPMDAKSEVKVNLYEINKTVMAQMKPLNL